MGNTNDDESVGLNPGNIPQAQSHDLAKLGDVLPGAINVLPSVARPFFPGQVLPMVLPATIWTTTLEAVHKTGHNILGVVYARAESPENVVPGDFATMGTACRIHQVQKQGDKLHVVMVGLQRFRIEEWISEKRPFNARVHYFPETDYSDVVEIKAYTTAIINVIKELLPLNPLYGEELKLFLNNFGTNDPSRLADFGASLTTADAGELQEILDAVHIHPRLEKTLVLLQKEVEIAKAQMEIRQHIESEMQSRQREVFLREQLKFIQKELGISKDDRTAEIERFNERLEKLDVPDGASQRIEEELEKLAVLEKGSPEFTVTRNYLDWLTALPWGKHSEDRLNLKTAAEILDRDHEGLDDVKQRILEFLGVGKMKGEVAGSILLLVGPPGVGKTSLGRSVANTLGREFYRFSLGGMRDDAEIKGHRRTYIGAMPGKFIQAIKECGTANPVIMLDEIDKIGSSFHGDPASALLEVLDPEQNHDFLDHYLDVRFDLSKTLFICTANQLDSIPGPLLDRMEVIRLSGYLANEKIKIAKHHLWPRLLRKAGLKKRGQVSIDQAAIRTVIEQYAREAGVRRLDKLLGTIVRKSVMKLLKNKNKPVRVKAKDIQEYLGKPVFTDEQQISGAGIVTGLAWTALGGATLSIESTKVHDSGQGLKLTGQLGDVMRESAEIAFNHVIANAAAYGISPDFLEKAFVHVHVPAGATPKDGPSAGITIAAALVSLASGKKPRRGLAMTGELTLTGQVLPVGGIREKAIAARRARIKQVILPAANRGDFDELPETIRQGISAHFVDQFSEVVSLLFR